MTRRPLVGLRRLGTWFTPGAGLFTHIGLTLRLIRAQRQLGGSARRLSEWFDMSDNPVKPNEATDVIVHFIRAIERDSGVTNDRWHVFVEDEKRLSFNDEDSAIEYARAIGRDEARRVWYLRRKGYPLEAVEI